MLSEAKDDLEDDLNIKTKLRKVRYKDLRIKKFHIFSRAHALISKVVTSKKSLEEVDSFRYLEATTE